MTGGIWSLRQTLNGFSADSKFGYALSYSSTGTQFAVGAYYTNSQTGMYEVYDIYIHIIISSICHWHIILLLGRS